MKPNRRLIKKAAEILRKGGLVGFPTETVYGIAADASNKKALAKLDKIKNRPKGKPYSLHVGYKNDIYKSIQRPSPLIKKIIKEYLPGPVTILVKDKKGRKTGFRMPDNDIALALIRAVGRPVVAPSANISGQPSPVMAEEVCAGLDMVLDGGKTKYKKDSTIVDLTENPPQVVRQGYVKLAKWVFEKIR
jgi:L-threonylcarbamoyladenylate synthase